MRRPFDGKQTLARAEQGTICGEKSAPMSALPRFAPGTTTACVSDSLKYKTIKAKRRKRYTRVPTQFGYKFLDLTFLNDMPIVITMKVKVPE